jgi:hypothetical protein
LIEAWWENNSFAEIGKSVSRLKSHSGGFSFNLNQKLKRQMKSTMKLFVMLLLFAILAFGFSIKFPIWQFAHRIAIADRVVATDSEKFATVTITNQDALAVVKAVSSASRDFNTYKCQFSLAIKFYAGTNYLGEVHNCGGLFLLDGKQYRAEDLRQLVQTPFSKAYKKAIKTMFEKQSETK